MKHGCKTYNNFFFLIATLFIGGVIMVIPLVILLIDLIAEIWKI